MSSQSLQKQGGRIRLTVVLAALVLGMVALSVIWSRQQASAPPDDGREIAGAFLDDLRNNHVDAAWAGTTAEFKSFLGRERLHAFVRSHSVLRTAVEFSDAQEVEANGIHLMAYTFRAGTAPAAIRVLLANEQGQWKVERLTVE